MKLEFETEGDPSGKGSFDENEGLSVDVKRKSTYAAGHDCVPGMHDSESRPNVVHG